MCTLTFADLEYETSISFWEFEIMIVLNILCLNFRSLHDEIHRTGKKVRFSMNSDSLICIWMWYFQLA